MADKADKLSRAGFHSVLIISSVLNYRRKLAMALVKLLSKPAFSVINPAEQGLPDKNYDWSSVDLLLVDLSEHKPQIRPWFFELSNSGGLPPVIFLDNNATVDDAGDMVRAGAADYIDMISLSPPRLSRALLIAVSRQRLSVGLSEAAAGRMDNDELATQVMPMIQEKAPSYTGSYPQISGMTDEPTEVMPPVKLATPESASDDTSPDSEDEDSFLTTGLIEILDRIQIEKSAAKEAKSVTDAHFLTTGLMSILERKQVLESELPKEKPPQATAFSVGHHWPFTQQQLEDRQASVGDYNIRKFIAVGGSASVFKVHSKKGGKALAMKLYDNEMGDEQGQERFLRGYRLIQPIRHPNIVTIREVGVSEGSAYVVMEFFSGGDLKSRLGEGISRQQAVHYVVEIAGALDSAHEQQILHRDLKPSNILFRADGSLALLDFGIAKLMAENQDNVTQAGQVVGTSHYVSPEQALGQEMDARSDLYALGVILYEMLEGKRPYTGSSPIETMQKHVRDPVPSLSGASDPLDQIISRLMAKNREDRYATGAALIDALTEAVPDLMDN